MSKEKRGKSNTPNGEVKNIIGDIVIKGENHDLPSFRSKPSIPPKKKD